MLFANLGTLFLGILVFVIGSLHLLGMVVHAVAASKDPSLAFDDSVDAILFGLGAVLLFVFWFFLLGSFYAQ